MICEKIISTQRSHLTRIPSRPQVPYYVTQTEVVYKAVQEPRLVTETKVEQQYVTVTEQEPHYVAKVNNAGWFMNAWRIGSKRCRSLISYISSN